MDINTASRLQALRKANGFSQDALAEQLGISRQAISKWERAESSPDTDNLIALSKLYGLTLDELLDNNGKVKMREEIEEEFIDRQIKGIERKAKNAIEKAKARGLYPNLAKNLFKFPFPIIIAIVYIVLGFVWDLWHPGWVVFLTIPMFYQFAAACKAKTKKGFLMTLPVPELIVLIYLAIGFSPLNLWSYTAIMYLIIPIYYWTIAVYVKGKKKENNNRENLED